MNRAHRLSAAAAIAAGGILPSELSRPNKFFSWTGTKRAGRTGPRPAKCEVHGIKISQRTDAWGHVHNWCRDCQGAAG